jgi:hypothetical protein
MSLLAVSAIEIRAAIGGYIVQTPSGEFVFTDREALAEALRETFLPMLQFGAVNFDIDGSGEGVTS